MKISYKWLSRYIDKFPEPQKLSELLTACGLEVEMMEHFQTVPGGLKGVVVGRVESCEKHPNADKLSLTKVNIGTSELLSVVCGAPNVAAGQMILLATVGTTVTTSKGEFVIQKAKIRGEVSEGMICAEDELGLGTSHAGIMVLPEDTPIGMPASEYFHIEDDFVYEIGLTPNRSDATSHLGVARDVVAVLNAQHLNGDEHWEIQFPSVEDFTVDSLSRNITVTLEDEAACPRYSGLTMTGITVKPSPDWLQNKLKAIGLRPINNIVDITNFVLYETGQPLHAFDADKISGDKVIVKKLAKDTGFITLDGVERKLDAEDLMICNAESGMCMAGVFGGLSSGVTEQTTSLFLESACFDPATIRKTSKRHNLKTDASFRFERGSDINVTVYALKRAAMMIKELAEGRIVSEIVDVCPGKTERVTLLFSLTQLDKIAGKHISKEIVFDIFKSLDFTIISESGDTVELAIPTAKVDVTREVDVIEEVLRIYGYGNIEFPESLRTNLSYRNKPDREQIKNVIADLLTDKGFHEILTNSLTTSVYTEKFAEALSPVNNVPILNPLSRELNVMRQSMLFSGLEVLIYNKNRKNADLKIYEFGNVYRLVGTKAGASDLEKYLQTPMLTLFLMGDATKEHWAEKSRKVTFYDLKASVEAILHRLGINRRDLRMLPETSVLYENAWTLNSGEHRVCLLGEVSSAVRNEFDLKEEVFYAAFDLDKLISLHASQKVAAMDIPKFPEVRRDLALLIGPEVSWLQIEELAFATGKKYLKEVNLFDVYTDEKMKGQQSYAVSFILQDEEKTLTDVEIDGLMKKLISAFERNLNATLR